MKKSINNPDGPCVRFAKHCLGLDKKKPYIRHGKYYYKPYRNYFDAAGCDVKTGERLAKAGYAEKYNPKYNAYRITDDGREWLGKILKITIHEVRW